MKKMVRMMILVPAVIKARLDSLRSQGITASGYIRSLIERDFKLKSKKARRKVSEGLFRARYGRN